MASVGEALLNGQLTNGAAFVGQRPVRAPRIAVQGELLILQVYCPDKVQDYKNRVADLKLANTVKR